MCRVLIKYCVLKYIPGSGPVSVRIDGLYVVILLSPKL